MHPSTRRLSVPEFRDARGSMLSALPVAPLELPAEALNAVRLQEAKNEKRPSFTISLKRDVYFDNDIVEGTLTIVSTSEFVIPKLTVAIVCRLIVKDQIIPEIKSAHTLYKSSKVIARDFFIEPGQATLPLSFAVPPHELACDLPCRCPTFETKVCSVRWDIRLLQQCNNKRYNTIARATFRKACLYRSLPGYCPKAQCDRAFVLQKSKPLQLEAALTKDVFATQEPIEVEVAVQSNGSVLRPKKLTASVVQYVDGWIDGREVFRRVTILDKSKHYPKRWTKRQVTDESGNTHGIMYTRKFSLLPAVDKNGKCASQRTGPKDGSDAGCLVQLTPSAECSKKDGATYISIKYAVIITCRIMGSEDMTLTLPFVIMSQPGNVPGNGVVYDEWLVFPPMDQPPAYSGHRRHSTASYPRIQRSHSSLSEATSGLIDANMLSAPSSSTFSSDSLSGQRWPSGSSASSRRSVPNLVLPRLFPDLSVTGTQSVIDELSDEDSEGDMPPEFNHEWSYDFLMRHGRLSSGSSSQLPRSRPSI